METTVKLSPPWYTFMNEVKHTLGSDSLVKVGDLNTSSSPFILPVTVANEAKAKALAAITKPFATIGNVVVKVEISYNGTLITPEAPTSAAELLAVTETALKGNTLYVRAQESAMYPGGPTIVWPVFTKSVIQFYNDNLADLYSNYNGVTAAVFANVLNVQPGKNLNLYPSTEE